MHNWRGLCCSAIIFVQMIKQSLCDLAFLQNEQNLYDLAHFDSVLDAYPTLPLSRQGGVI